MPCQTLVSNRVTLLRSSSRARLTRNEVEAMIEVIIAEMNWNVEHVVSWAEDKTTGQLFNELRL